MKLKGGPLTAVSRLALISAIASMVIPTAGQWTASAGVPVVPAGSGEKFEKYTSKKPDERLGGCWMTDVMASRYHYTFIVRCPDAGPMEFVMNPVPAAEGGSVGFKVVPPAGMDKERGRQIAGRLETVARQALGGQAFVDSTSTTDSGNAGAAALRYAVIAAAVISMLASLYILGYDVFVRGG
jgi:hypothetical protein